MEEFFNQLDSLKAIIEEDKPFNPDFTYDKGKVSSCIKRLASFIVSDGSEKKALLEYMEKTDFYTAPASTRFHGDSEGGLAAHSLLVFKCALSLAKSFFDLYKESPNTSSYQVSAEDLFVASIAHDFCKIDTYYTEFRNVKDILGNWKKVPQYKTRLDSRALGHGNESVLRLLEVMPSFMKKRYVIEAVSRHMGFSDLSPMESYNYSNFLDNPLLVLLQTADEVAAQWFGI